nr:hypothetical protein [Actinomadura rubrisoli]
MGTRSRRSDQAATALPRRAWQTLSAGTGAKGRLYQWALVDIDRGQSGCR